MINVIEILVSLKNRNRNTLTNPIGSVLKYRRKELKLTLEEGSEGICSVSYLSKVENNVIMPSEQYVDLLMKKYQIDPEMIENFEYQNEKEKLIEAMFFNKDYEFTKAENNNYSSYQTALLEYGSNVLGQRNLEDEQPYRELAVFLSNMPEEECNIFLLLINIRLYQELRFSDAITVLQKMIWMEEYKKLEYMKNKWLLKNTIKLNNFVLFEQTVNDFMAQSIDFSRFDELESVKQSRMLFIGQYEQLKMRINSIPYLNQEQTKQNQYKLAKGYIKYQKYDLAYEITKQHLNDEHFLAIHLLTLNALKKVQEIVYLLTTFHLETIVNRTAYIIYRQMFFKYKSSKEDYLHYLRTTILGYRHITDEMDVLKFLVFDAYDAFKKNYFYKEATEVMNKYLPLFKALSNEL